MCSEKLATIASRGFMHAVAFHGRSDAGISIGGAAPDSLKLAVQAAVESAVAGSGIEVKIAGPDDDLDGGDPCNLVNRLTLNRRNGIQIEQSLRARDKFWEAIAEAVVDLYSASVALVVLTSLD